jgi:hydrogenase maturation protein HypF
MSRRRFRVSGVVQGVGFRPFVYGLATRRGLGGFVLNDGNGVVAEVEGEERALEAFAEGLRTEAPPLARVEAVVAEPLAPRGERSFRIVPSRPTDGAALIPPDVATCEDCVRELFDAGDRRYRYPFVNCTQCGPRFTIVRSVPYDRANTTMAGFRLCEDCHREYEDPLDRRFHAEPTCCPACGPRLTMPLEEAVGLLREGRILAVKGLGGYHLACDAADEEAVARLRSRKHREEKPFAILTSEPDSLAEVSPAELELLRSPVRPVVLVRRREDAVVAGSVAPGTPWLGLLLPYSPLHHLLAADFEGPLVLTSGNVSDEPIAFRDTDARKRLEGIADAFLGHDRPVHRRCEDSVVRAGFPLRRSRGHVPSALPLSDVAPPLVAAGAELKSTFCVARGAEAFLSAHLGDLDSEPAYRAFRADLELYLAMLRLEPELVVHDLHPEYLATKWALEQDAELVGVQHHHAHAAACLAEHGETGPALALVFDGTGYGTDGTLWGSELLRCDLAGFERLAHLEPVPLPGGEAAIREPWRVAAVAPARGGRGGGGGGARGALAGVDTGAREPQARPAARLRPGPPVRRGCGGTRRSEARQLRGAGGDRARAAGRRATGQAVSVALRRRDGAGRPLRRGSRSQRGGGRALPRDRLGGRRGGVCRDRRAADGRALGRQLPEPAPAGLDARAARARGLPRPLEPAGAAERRRHKLRPGGSRGEEEQVMCLGIPAQIVQLVDADAGIAKAEISGVRRNVSVALCPEAQVGDWVLVHVGFALSRIDEEQARETLELLEQMGEAYEQELREIRESAAT